MTFPSPRQLPDAPPLPRKRLHPGKRVLPGGALPGEILYPGNTLPGGLPLPGRNLLPGVLPGGIAVYPRRS